MKIAIYFACLCVGVGFIAFAAESSVLALKVESIDFESIGTDRVELRAQLAATSNKKVSLRNLVFDRVTMDGVPVQVPSIDRKFTLEGGKEWERLPQLRAIIAYRSFESLDPLRRAVQDGKIRIHVEARGQLQLNLFESLALRAWGPWITLQVDQDVAVLVPGGLLGRAAAMAALTVAEPVWVTGRAAQEQRLQRTHFAQEAETAMSGNLVAIHTTYELEKPGAAPTTVDVWCLGFFKGKGLLLAPAESVQPWLFDPAQAEALSTETLNVRLRDIEVWPLLSQAAQTPFSLNRKEIRLVRKSGDTETAFSFPARKRYQARFRDKTANAVLFEVHGWADHKDGLPHAADSEGDWQPAIVVRLNPVGAKPRSSFWLTEAHREGDRFRLRDAVDNSAIGSPLWIAGGVAGLVQDSVSAAPLEELSLGLH